MKQRFIPKGQEGWLSRITRYLTDSGNAQKQAAATHVAGTQKALNAAGDAWHSFWNWQLNAPMISGNMYSPVYTGTTDKKPMTYTTTPKQEAGQAMTMTAAPALAVSAGTVGIPTTVGGLVGGAVVGNAGKKAGEGAAQMLGLNENAQDMFGTVGEFAGIGKGFKWGSDFGKAAPLLWAMRSPKYVETQASLLTPKIKHDISHITYKPEVAGDVWKVTAFDGDKAIGYVSGDIKGNKYGFDVGSSHIDESYRRMGIASQMYREAAVLAQKHNKPLTSFPGQHMLTLRNEKGLLYSPSRLLWENFVKKGEAKYVREPVMGFYKMKPIKIKTEPISLRLNYMPKQVKKKDNLELFKSLIKDYKVPIVFDKPEWYINNIQKDLINNINKINDTNKINNSIQNLLKQGIIEKSQGN